MWSFIGAFRACRVIKKPRVEAASRPTPFMVLRQRSSGFVLILGLSCLPLGTGCRSKTPTDWVGERMAMTQAWQGQTSQVRSEDASFQEGWRNGFQDGQAQENISPADREPAQFEAFMNSKREEAMANSRRGYETGFTEAAGSGDRHQAHSELFAETATAAVETIHTDQTTERKPPTSSLFGIPRNRNWQHQPVKAAEVKAAEIEPAEAVQTPAFTSSEEVSPPPVGFGNAAVVLDSAIKKNGAPAILTHESKSMESSERVNSRPAKPNSSETESKPASDLQPGSIRSITELPIDDDVAESEQPTSSLIAISLPESSTNSSPNQFVVEVESATHANPHLQFGQVPQAYQGRLQMGQLIANPYVTSNDSASPETSSADQTSTGAPAQVTQDQVAPDQVAIVQVVPAQVTPAQVTPILATGSNASGVVAPIATDAPDALSVQVKHEVKPSSPARVTAIGHLPKGLPLRKQK